MKTPAHYATSAEPMCCDEPMVHNSFTGEYECANAYFELLDDGVLNDCSPLGDDPATMTDYQRERYEHWRSSRVPDAEVKP